MVKDRRSCRAAWGLKESDTTEQLNKCHLGSPFLKISVYFCLYLNCFVYMKAKQGWREVFEGLRIHQSESYLKFKSHK